MNNFKSMIAGLDDAGLAELEAAVKSATSERRPAIDLNDIKPGMKPEDLARVRAEIARIASEGRS